MKRCSLQTERAYLTWTRRFAAAHARGRSLPPRSLLEPRQRDRDRVHLLHDRDVAAGAGRVRLPHAPARKYPRAPLARGWQYLFPAARLSVDPRTGVRGRHHLDDAVLARALNSARLRAGIGKPPSAHALRQPFITRLLEAGCSIRTVRELRGHKDLSTTRICTHVPGPGASAVRSPPGP